MIMIIYLNLIILIHCFFPDPDVILIVMHLCRQALLRGDLSDNDYLMSDDLKRKVAYIAHFAFDDYVYDCEQNREQAKKLCADLKDVVDPRRIFAEF